MNFDFADPGNGPEMLTAGAFTIIAVVGSVLIALWSQRRDFDRREVEMKSAYKAQNDSEWATWRRHMAERAMGVITDAAQAGLAFHDSGRSYLEAHHEVDEIHSLLHLDPHPSGRIVGDWLMHTCHEMDLMRPVNTREKVLQINETASIARAQVMVWAHKPESAMKDPRMMAAAAAAHQGNKDGHHHG